MRRPGKLVQCTDGRIGRTYNDEPFINGKVRVYVFSGNVQAQMEATTQKDMIATANGSEGKPAEKRLCSPEALTVIGYAD